MSTLDDCINAIQNRLPKIAEAGTALSHFASVLQGELVEPSELAIEFRRFASRVLRRAQVNAGDHPYASDLGHYAAVLEPTPSERQTAIDCIGVAAARMRRKAVLPEEVAARRIVARFEDAETWVRG